MMSTASRHSPRFKVGDWVSFHYGPRQVWAQIIEDRGTLGVNSRRLYRIRLNEESGEAVAFEMPEDDLARAQPSKEAIINYLKQGGLLHMLQSNLGGKHPPRVWLAFDPQGRVITTFVRECGIVGGETAPFFALLENTVFSPKKEEVIQFLRSFSLNRDESEDVLRSVGTAP